MNRLIFIFLIFLSINCFGQKKKLFLRKGISIDSVCILTPITNVYSISKEDSLELNLMSSQLAETSINKALQDVFPESINHIYKSVPLEDQEKIKNSIIEHTNSYNSISSLKKIVINDSLINQVNKAGYHYSLIILNSGFSRTSTNFINERIKAQIINLFLFGIVDAINSPIGVEIIVREKASIMTAILIDNRKHNIAFYKTTYNIKEDPYNQYVLKGMVREIISDCLL
ncbi:MAG: hypothetical protein C0459_09105 [Chitinophaga sp.]|jgi:hypothetical protein|nr:hypothetical protein [Chitinophaga sp.]